MTNPMTASAVQSPHVPTVVWTVGIVLGMLVLYHIIHKH